MGRDLLTSIPQFVSIPQNDDDPRNPPEIINLGNVDYIQFFEPNKIMLHFASGKTKILSGDRAKKFVESLNIQQ